MKTSITRTSVFSFVVAASTIAFGCGAMAQGVLPATASQEPMSTVQINGHVPDHAAVEISGQVIGKQGDALIIQRAGGPIRAHIAPMMADQWMTFYSGRTIDHIRRGEEVTVFGHLLDAGQGPKIETQAVYDTSNGTLYLPNVTDQLEAMAPFARPWSPDGVFDTRYINLG